MEKINLKNMMDVLEKYKGQFDGKQIKQIRIGLEKGLDVSQYADPKFDASQMHYIQRGLNLGLDVTQYADPQFTSYQMSEIFDGLRLGVDVSQYADPKFDASQMYQIRKGLENKVDVSWYAYPNFDVNKMIDMREELEKIREINLESTSKIHSFGKIMNDFYKKACESKDPCLFCKNNDLKKYSRDEIERFLKDKEILKLNDPDIDRVIECSGSVDEMLSSQTPIVFYGDFIHIFDEHQAEEEEEEQSESIEL